MIRWMWRYIRHIWSAVRAVGKASFQKRLVAVLSAVVLVVTAAGMVRPARTATSEDASAQQTADGTVQTVAAEQADPSAGTAQTAAGETADQTGTELMTAAEEGAAAQTMPAGSFTAATATSVQAGSDQVKSVATSAEVSYEAGTFQSGSSFSMKFLDKNAGDAETSARAESDRALADAALAPKGEQTAACYPYALTFLDTNGSETEPAASVHVKLTFAEP
ncbi:MAG: hypothetical protein ACI4D6_03805, partial [Chordicoccus sp.]